MGMDAILKLGSLGLIACLLASCSDNTQRPSAGDAGTINVADVIAEPDTAQSPTVSSLRFVAAPYQLRVGQRLEVSVDAIYSDGTTHTNPVDTRWSLADDTIATFDTNTLRLEGSSPGQTELRASLGDVTSTTTVVVNALPTLDITPDEVLLAPSGQTELTVEARDGDGAVVEDPAIEWRSSDRFFIVDDGAVRASGLGEATITASWRGVEDSVVVRSEMIDRIDIIPHGRTIYEGDRLQLEVHHFNASGDELVADEQAIWTSDDPDVASIDSSGLLTAESGGRTTIRVQSAGKQTSTHFLVDVRFKDLKCHEEFCCALSTHGHVYCFGNNAHGQLASNSFSSTNWLRRIKGDDRLETFDISYTHGCGLNKSGQAFCWGADWSGALGYDTTHTHTYQQVWTTGVSFEVAPVDTSLRFKQIKPQFHATFGLTDAGALYVWGHWPAADPYVSPIPQPNYERPSLLDEGPWDAIAQTRDNVLCLKKGSDYWCMGYNLYDEQGQGPDADLMIDTLVRWPAQNPLTTLRGGYHGLCGLDADHQVWCSGWNVRSLMGKPYDPYGSRSREALSTYIPQRTPWPNKFDELRAGEGEFFCGLRNGDVWCWGSNASCQLGYDPGSDYHDLNQGENHSSTPVEMSFLPDNWVDISLGSWAGCLLNDQGQIWCWGLNDMAPYTLEQGQSHHLECDPSLRRVYPYSPQ